MISRALLNAPFFIPKDADLLRNRKVNTKKRQNRHLPELAFLILGTYFTAPFLKNIRGKVLETMEKREQLGSRLGFIMLSAGCAIGCGNVWKFPWMCGQNGGGSFMLVYVICLLILGLPAMVMELSVGRAAQTSPLYMYEKLSGKRKWKIPGIVCLIGNIALIAFYSVVAG